MSSEAALLQIYKSSKNGFHPIISREKATAVPDTKSVTSQERLFFYIFF